MQADKLTDGIAAALSHPVKVQVVNKGRASGGGYGDRFDYSRSCDCTLG
ncbi:hypothetical protein ACJ3_42710 [Pantoea sp. QMID3]|nr:hypothetical protein ACJ3_42710 [Pantoea sp. QMID3]